MLHFPLHHTMCLSWSKTEIGFRWVVEGHYMKATEFFLSSKRHNRVDCISQKKLFKEISIVSFFLYTLLLQYYSNQMQYMISSSLQIKFCFYDSIPLCVNFYYIFPENCPKWLPVWFSLDLTQESWQMERTCLIGSMHAKKKKKKLFFSQSLKLWN